MAKSILKKILAILARRTIARHKPIIIGVTGSVGKTSTRNAIFAVLKKKYRVRTAEKNYNTEIGFPLSILGIPYCGKNAIRWIYWIVRATLPQKKYPDILVLEYGIDHPGDMDYLLSIAKPRIAVMTTIGATPVHVEFFKGPKEVTQEKAKLVHATTANGCVILNHDDRSVLDMKEAAHGKVMTYGQEHHANLRITNYSLHLVKSLSVGDLPDGISFKLTEKGATVPFRIHDCLGVTHAYAVAAAAAVGLVMQMNLVEISQALEGFIPPPGRLRLIRGNKHTLIIDDTYNAAPLSMQRALEALHELPGKRKIAVLGDMKELGRYSEQAHRIIGDAASHVVDILFCVGPHAKFIAEEFQVRAPDRKLYRFDDSSAAARAIEPMLQVGDLVLVKGSQSMRMERVVEEIMAEPARVSQLLVRQETYWKNRE